jgi:hypothetical protein
VPAGLIEHQDGVAARIDSEADLLQVLGHGLGVALTAELIVRGRSRAPAIRMSPATDWRRILLGRSLRAFADGYVAILLLVYLSTLGFEAVAVGAISTATLLGSALLTLALGIAAHRVRRRPALLGAALLMAVTGFGFTAVQGFWPLLIIAFVGTLNPSGGGVSVLRDGRDAAGGAACHCQHDRSSTQSGVRARAAPLGLAFHVEPVRMAARNRRRRQAAIPAAECV